MNKTNTTVGNANAPVKGNGIVVTVLAIGALFGMVLFAIRFKLGSRGTEPFAPRQMPVQVAAIEENFSAGTKFRARKLSSRVCAVRPTHFANMLHRWRVGSANRLWLANSELRAEMTFLFSNENSRAGDLNGADLFVLGPSGWRVRRSHVRGSGSWSQGEQHVDQFLATCAECGIPLNRTIQSPNGPVALSELLRSSRRDFVSDQEIAWSVVAYCLYMPGEARWKNRFGESHSYESLAEAMLVGAESESNCWGTHRLYALAIMLQSDSESHFLSARLRRHILQHFARTSARLVGNQRRIGAWGGEWAKEDSKPTDTTGTTIDTMISVTGHHLEWMALVPKEARPDAASLHAAVEFLLKACEQRNFAAMRKRYCPYSHAARALKLLTGLDRVSGRPNVQRSHIR